MSRKKHTVEEIIGKLQGAEVEVDRTVVDACRQLGESEQTHFRLREEYGDLKLDQARWHVTHDARFVVLTQRFRKTRPCDSSRARGVPQLD